ncbi:hypothetical protein SPRG_19288 [Saprolegnia parasitica CBS 223.65]|uniref:Uncharacterized protein n=1 Tax=Saprolegnia parasitica (strain CBS 223.65) TaxID=695850 RepID=A0A067CT73_SAPPC|nr:hypothetical protein SPRG_19288 [Saprolegnia parasitica CBS 223.65]KDO33678.1 hypothetical protein SPRG_19288 [Saprolegnia parasitica CBS 223.65]|eukprot:XP_012195705.1 hypothetical protein SPRG_19288 [Saprolegnia parasitica CBS 223.65]
MSELPRTGHQVHVDLLALFPSPPNYQWDLEIVAHAERSLASSLPADDDSLLDLLRAQHGDGLVLAVALAIVAVEQRLVHAADTGALLLALHDCQRTLLQRPYPDDTAHRVGIMLLTSRHLPALGALRTPESTVLEIEGMLHLLAASLASGVALPCRLPVAALCHDVVNATATLPAPLVPRLLESVHGGVAAAIQSLYAIYPAFLKHTWPSTSSFVSSFHDMLSSDVPAEALAPLATALPPLRVLTVGVAVACLDLVCNASLAALALASIAHVACVPSPDAEAPLLRKLQMRLVTTIPPSQMEQLVVPLQVALDATDALVPLDADCIRGPQLACYLQLLPFLPADMTFPLALRGLRHNLVEVALACHRAIRSLLLQRRPRGADMAVVYVGRLLAGYPTTTPIDVLTTSLGYVLAVDDDAVLAFLALEMQKTIRRTFTTQPDAASTLARLFFELLKVVSLESMGFFLRIAEQIVFAHTSLATTLYEAISTSCEASRRTLLTEWYLGFYPQLESVPSML